MRAAGWCAGSSRPDSHRAQVPAVGMAKVVTGRLLAASGSCPSRTTETGGPTTTSTAGPTSGISALTSAGPSRSGTEASATGPRTATDRPQQQLSGLRVHLDRWLAHDLHVPLMEPGLQQTEHEEHLQVQGPGMQWDADLLGRGCAGLQRGVDSREITRVRRGEPTHHVRRLQGVPPRPYVLAGGRVRAGQRRRQLLPGRSRHRSRDGRTPERSTTRQ